MKQADSLTVRIEFDGGTSCNDPGKGYGEGYGSYQIGDREVVRVTFGVGHSCNSAEIRTLVAALHDLGDSIEQPWRYNVLARGDSRIALKWATHKGPIKGKPSAGFVEAIALLRRAVARFASVRTEWRSRIFSVELFGH